MATNAEAKQSATLGTSDSKLRNEGTSGNGDGIGHLLEAAGLACSKPRNTLDGTVNFGLVKMTALKDRASEPLFKKPRLPIPTEVSASTNRSSTKRPLAATTDLMQGRAGLSLQEQIRMVLEDQQRQLHQQMAAARSCSSSIAPASSSSSTEITFSSDSAPPVRRQELGDSSSSSYSDSNSPPAESGDDSVETLALRRRLAKREYSKAYRVQQKGQVAVLEVQLSQANMALQLLQNMYVQLEIKYNELVDRQRETTAARPSDAQRQETNSAVEQLRMENESLRKKLQAQVDLGASRDGLVRQLLVQFGPINEAQTVEEGV